MGVISQSITDCFLVNRYMKEAWASTRIQTRTHAPLGVALARAADQLGKTGWQHANWIAFKLKEMPK